MAGDPYVAAGSSKASPSRRWRVVVGTGLPAKELSATQSWRPPRSRCPIRTCRRRARFCAGWRKSRTPAAKNSLLVKSRPCSKFSVVRRGAHAHGYFNSCPHAGSPLNWTPGNFLDPTRTLIQCATHGAPIHIDDGVCVSGPCPGARLTAVPVTVKDGKILIAGPGEFS